MFSSKTKSGLSDASINKGAPSTPRAGKLGRAGSTKADPASPFLQQSARLSVDRSPKPVDSKPTIEHRSPKINTPDKQPRAAKTSELQAQLSAIQDELKKSIERLASVEKEKSQILEELKYAKRCADEANDKLQDALVSQRIAEEAAEIDKFRADELEQAGIDAAQKREEEWQKELETIRNQHAVDVAALLATTQELQRAKQELTMTTEAKNNALSHADDAMKIAEINADKVEFLSREVSRLKALLDAAQESKKDEISQQVEKVTYLQAQLNLVQEDLKKANEQLASVEAEKANIIEELKDANRSAEEANEKLKENLVTQKKVEDAFEAYKIRASELEQEILENAQKREEELQKKFETVENQNILNLTTLLSTTEELEKVKQELVMAVDAKNTALTHACDAMVSSEINAEKLELLSEEVSQLKALLDSKMEFELEVIELRSELEKAKATAKRLVEVEALVEALRTDVSVVKKAETDACHLMDKWRNKAELLEVQLEETSGLRKSSLETLASVMKQLEECNAILQDKECEVFALSGKVESLNLEISRQKTELDESSQQLNAARNEAAEMEKTITLLKSELQITEAANLNALSNEKAAILNIQSMTEERKKLENELDATLLELEKSKKATEGLASALHEVSTEARGAQERFLTKQSEVEDSQAQIQALKLTIKEHEENYEATLEKAKQEIVCLQDTLERFERELEQSRSEWDLKALDFVSSITRSEEEIEMIKADMEKITDSLKEEEIRAREAKEDAVQPMDNVKLFESEENADNISAEFGKAEIVTLKELILSVGKENGLRSVIQENNDPKILESTAFVIQRQALDSFLAEPAARKQEKNGDKQSDSRVPIETAHDKQSDSEVPIENLNENANADGILHGDKQSDAEVPLEKLKENVNADGTQHGEKVTSITPQEEQLHTEFKDLPMEKEHETKLTYEGLDSKADDVCLDMANGLTSDNTENGSMSQNKQQPQQQKKRMAVMKKFGSLLKKKSNHKLLQVATKSHQVFCSLEKERGCTVHYPTCLLRAAKGLLTTLANHATTFFPSPLVLANCRNLPETGMCIREAGALITVLHKTLAQRGPQVFTHVGQAEIVLPRDEEQNQI